MLRDRRYGGASKATPSTVCQKCLKRDKSLLDVSRNADVLISKHGTTATNANLPHRRDHMPRARHAPNSS
jgi:hypothetical protein